MNSKIKEAMKKEREIEGLVNSVKEELCDKVSNAGVMEGVKEISQNPQIAVVSFKTLVENGSNWSPSTYIPASQAKAVKDTMETVKTANGFQKKVEEMLETGKVKVKNDTITLNNNTKKILRETLEE